MTVLVDSQIDQLLAARPPLATNVPRGDFSGPNSQIQAASLDLSVGDIFIPGADADKPGGSHSPHTRVSLREGRIAVIRTAEFLAMPSDLVGLGFPPSSLSIQGVFMTNPGQIDPGYRGPLHLTVVNMSKEPLTLFRGQRIIRLIFAKLDAAPSADYQARHPRAARSPITDELLQALSIDFLDVDQRASDAVKSAQVKAGIWSAVIAAVVGVVVSSITGIIPRYFDRYHELDSRISTLTATVDVATMKDRLDRLEAAAKLDASASARLPAPATSPSKPIQSPPGSPGPAQAPKR